MIDATTQKPIFVSTDGTAGPYLMVPVRQLDDVRELLVQRGVQFWVEEDVISLNGEPEIAVMNLGHGAAVDSIQAILDSVP